MLKAVGGSGVLAAATGLGLTAVVTASPALAKEIGPLNPRQRQRQEYAIRQQCAREYLQEQRPAQPANDDEDRYADKRASYSKCLPHNDLGEVDLQAYQRLRSALDSGDPAAFESLELAPEAGLGVGRRLTCPQAAYAYEMTGIGTHASRIAPAPAFESTEASAEMGELYWQALTRDVAFRDYEADPLIATAVEDLNRFATPVGPKVDGRITPAILFRGIMAGDLPGPYISQFLFLPVPYGAGTIEQKYPFPVAGEDFMTRYDDWLASQRGATPSAVLRFEPTPRFIRTNRDLARYVQVDVSFQAFFHAALILLQYGPDALAPGNPYRASFTQLGFTTFGMPDIVHLVTKASVTALKSTWYQKWLVHRRLRPEVYAGRVENQRRGAKNYDVPAELNRSAAVERTLERYGNALLPQAYPDGSPSHPAYPSGHATYSGSCATILKAFFNEDFVLPEPVEPSADGATLEPITAELTVGGEINKLVSNIGLGRGAGSIHYRSDVAQGMLVGEQMALGILRDYSRTYNEAFPGFQLTTFGGTKVRVADGEVILGDF